MSIDKETARRVAHLARIEVAEADLGPLAAELSAILGFMEQLREVDVDGRRADDLGDADAAAVARGRGHRRRRSATRCSRTRRTRAPASSPCRRWSNERARRA